MVTGACNNIAIIFDKISYKVPKNNHLNSLFSCCLHWLSHKIKALCFQRIWHWENNKMRSFVLLYTILKRPFKKRPFIIQCAVRKKNKVIYCLTIGCVTKRMEANDAGNTVWTMIYLWFCPFALWEQLFAWPEESSIDALPETS